MLIRRTYEIDFERLLNGTWKITCRGHLLGLGDENTFLNLSPGWHLTKAKYALFHRLAR